MYKCQTAEFTATYFNLEKQKCSSTQTHRNQQKHNYIHKIIVNETNKQKKESNTAFELSHSHQ